MKPGRIIVSCIVAATAGVAFAQVSPISPISPAAPTRAAGPTLHEDLPGPGVGASPSPFIGDEPGAGRNPSGFSSGDKVLPEPRSDAPRANEPVFGERGIATDRETAIRPDLDTGKDGTLHYVSVFNPDVLPFKRNAAFDGLREDYTMVVARTAAVEIPVGGQTEGARDRFWGSLVIKLSPGVDVALPSVAPDMRILSYEVEPRVPLTFSRDGADNFFVRTDEPSARGTTHRLVFLVDADGGYFAPSLPTAQRYSARLVSAMAPPEIKPALPPRVMRAAQRTLDRLQLDASTELSVGFNRLVKYFRAFEAKASPASSGDIYRDLCDSQAGVCRHRSFAFMVTANALGIPTRFVHNEAHAFVEVWFPERQWQRIDLGGAALRLEVDNAANKTLHRPRGDDPFAKPPGYGSNYTQLQGEIGGLSRAQLDDKRAPLEEAPASGAFAGAEGGAFTDPNLIAGPSADITPRVDDPKKPTPSPRVTAAAPVGYRGATLRVEGRVDIGSSPMVERLVDIFLVPSSGDDLEAVWLSATITLNDGTFAMDAPLPPSLSLRAYRVVATTREDAQYNGAVSP
jgi:transglutaminase-like putative cysteine protease